MKKSFVILLILILLPIPVFSGEGMKALTGGGFLSGKLRKVLAKEIESSITKIDKATPSLRPEQRHWLVEERDALRDVAIYTKRYLNFLDSTEYAINYVKSHSKVLLFVLQKIQLKNNEKRDEARYWTFVVHGINDHEFWQSVKTLVNRGIVEAEVLEGHQYPHLDYVTLGNSILSRIIIPFFEGSLPD